MRFTAPAIIARRQGRGGTISHALVFVSAKNRATGDIEQLGLWTGDDHQQFTIGGQVRTYFGAGNVLDVPPVRTEIGLDVRRYRIGLSAISNEVQTLLRGYDPKGAPVEVHRAEFDGSGNLIAEPERIFRGWVNGAPITTGAMGGQSTAALECVSNTRMLTIYGSATKSDEVQRLRQGDRFRRYATAASSATVYWGETRPNPAPVREAPRQGTEYRSSDR